MLGCGVREGQPCVGVGSTILVGRGVTVTLAVVVLVDISVGVGVGIVAETVMVVAVGASVTDAVADGLGVRDSR